jgi:hypothetical protein
MGSERCAPRDRGKSISRRINLARSATVKRLLVGFAFLVLGAIGASSAPVAAQADVVGSFGAFTLTGSNGYRILVLADSRRADGRGEVVIFVGRRRSGVSYFAPANVTDAHIEADLGGLGRIAVRFVPSGAIEEESACGGDPTQFEAGAYEGSIEFNGEQGYTKASATRVRAEVKPFLSLVCTGRGEGETRGSGLPGAGLIIRSSARRLTVRLNKNRPGARVRCRAEIKERRGKIAISRSVEGWMPGSAFLFARDLRSASVDPPAPFSGAASFHRAAAPRNQWTGSLSIDFPGSANVPLVGGGLKALLVPARYTLDRPDSR